MSLNLAKSQLSILLAPLAPTTLDTRSRVGCGLALWIWSGCHCWQHPLGHPDVQEWSGDRPHALQQVQASLGAPEGQGQDGK